MVFYKGSMPDFYFVGRQNKTSWTFNLVNYYVVMPGVAVVMMRVEKPGAGEADI